MSAQKIRLLVLIAIEIVLIVIRRILDSPPENIQAWHLEAGWHYWAAMGFGMYLMFYVVNSKCPK